MPNEADIAAAWPSPDQWVFYASSYPTVVLALRTRRLRELFIVTRNETVARFCARLQLPFRSFPEPVDRSLIGLRAHRDRLRAFAAAVAGRTVVFGHHHADIWGLYLMGQLQSANRVLFRNLDNILPRCSLREREYWRGWRDRLVYLYVARVWIDMFHLFYLHADDHGLFGVHPDRLARRFDPYDQADETAALEGNREAIVRAFGLGTYDLVYVDNVGYLPEVAETVLHLLRRLRDRGWNITIKPHPWATPDHAYPDFPRIDTSVPAELLFLSVRYAVLGVYSTSLEFLSRYTTAISLLDLLDLRSAGWHAARAQERYIRKHIIGPSVLLPKTEEELDACLNASSPGFSWTGSHNERSPRPA